MSNCRSLIELPKNLWKLSNLRRLEIRGTKLIEMPEKIGSLKNLEILTSLWAKRAAQRSKLGSLSQLQGELCISKLRNLVSPEDAAEARLEEKAGLFHLKLKWDDDNGDPKNDRDVLEQLRPPSNLGKLKIKFYGDTIFPRWLGDSSFSNMLLLHLSNCKNCLYLPPLWQLPSLQILFIEWMTAVKRVGPEFYGANKAFQSLKSLTFQGMLEWEEWVSSETMGENSLA